MKNRRHSELSESETSDEAPQPEKSSRLSAEKAKMDASEDSSDSSSEPQPRHQPLSPPVQRREPSTSPKKTIASNPIEIFISQNPSLTKLAITDVVSEDDEVCILEVPKTIDPAAFIGKSIHFHRRTKIKQNKTKYVIEPSIEDIKPINLLSKKLQIVHPIAILKMREYTKVKHQGEAVDLGKFTPTLPENLKVRHPLFGAEYKNKIVLSQEIQEKLDCSIEQALRKMKKKKKHKKHQELSFDEGSSQGKQKKKHKRDVIDPESIFEQEDNKQESIFALLEEHVSEKKKAKRNVEGEVSFLNSDDSREKKKRRKNSVKTEVPDVALNETFLRETSFEKQSKIDKKKRRNSVKEEIDESISLARKFEEEIEVEKKKKRKNSVMEEANKRDPDIFPGTSFGEGNYDKKHKKRIKEEDASINLNGAFQDKPKDRREMTKTELNVSSLEENRNKKKQKSKTNESFQSSESVTDIEENNKKEIKKEKKAKGKNKVKEEIKREINEQMLDDSNFEKDYQDGQNKHTKKNKKNSIINSTVIPGLQLPLFDFDVSGITQKDEQATRYEAINEETSSCKKKKKKEKKFDTSKDNSMSLDEENSQLDDLEDDSSHKSSKKRKKKQNSDDDAETSSPKKKRRKHDSKETNTLISDLLSKVKSEMDSSVKPHKSKNSES